MFDTADLSKAITSALAQPDIVPAGKHLALVTVAHADGTVQAAIAAKVGQHWTFGGEVDWHGGDVSGGAKVQASW